LITPTTVEKLKSLGWRMERDGSIGGGVLVTYSRFKTDLGHRVLSRSQFTIYDET
jgi:hypothetical protein